MVSLSNILNIEIQKLKDFFLSTRFCQLKFINFVYRYDIHSRSYKKSIRLLGDNDDEFSSTSTNKPTVEIDGCKVSAISMITLYISYNPLNLIATF